MHLLFWGVSRFLGFPSNNRFLCQIPASYTNIPCYLWFYAQYCAWCMVGAGGFLCVDKIRLHPCMWCYLGVQFNLPAGSPIPGTSPAPNPAGDWLAELRGSSVSRTSQL